MKVILSAFVFVLLVTVTVMGKLNHQNNNQVVNDDLKMPLISAVKKGDHTLIKELLSRGTDVNEKDEKGGTALFYAAGRGDNEAIRILLNAGADLNVRNNDGRTALWFASRNGKDDGVTVYALAKGGGDVNAADKWGGTPLIASMDPGGTVANVEALLNSGAKVNAQNGSGDSALRIAVSWGATEATRLLLDNGANVNIQRNDGRTPLMEAAEGGHVEMIRLLLAKGADQNVKDKEGQTALMLVGKRNRSEILRLLSSPSGQQPNKPQNKNRFAGR